MTLPTTTRTRTTNRTFTTAHVRWLRRALCESTREFATRFSVSRRTVEAWELGTRHPNKYILPKMLRVYRQCVVEYQNTTG